MTAANRSHATAPLGARLASGLLPSSYTTTRDVTIGHAPVNVAAAMGVLLSVLAAAASDRVSRLKSER